MVTCQRLAKLNEKLQALEMRIKELESPSKPSITGEFVEAVGGHVSHQRIGPRLFLVKWQDKDQLVNEKLRIFDLVAVVVSIYNRCAPGAAIVHPKFDGHALAEIEFPLPNGVDTDVKSE